MRFAAIALCAAAAAQTDAPLSRNAATAELNAFSNYPLMRADCRVQTFYDVAEIGAPTRTVQRLTFRYDGPFASGTGTHVIAQWTILVGATARTLDELGSDFAANVTQPLTTAVSRTNFNFALDTQSGAGPHAWGGTSGQLSFPFAPVSVSVPPNGCFVVELLARGNTNRFLANAMLDAHGDANGVVPGSSFHAGTGCPASPGGTLDATVTVSGSQVAPGTALTIHGDGYPPGARVLTWLAGALLATPIVLPNTTPACTLYVDPAVSLTVLDRAADATGRLTPFANGSWLPVPRNASLSGASIWLQNFGIGVPSSANPFGINPSNHVRLTLGSVTSPATRVWFAGHHLAADATHASVVDALGYALRIE